MNLTDVEQHLIHHVVDGTVLDLAPGMTDGDINENVMRSWGKLHQIRAEVVREILRGRHLPDDGPDPHGLQLRGAWIVGRIDLDGITTPIRLQLSSCYLPDGLDGRNCVIPRLGLDGSVIASSSGHGEQGAVRLSGARIAGSLEMRGTTLTNEAGPALVADGLTVEGGAFLDGAFTASGHGELGAVRLVGARIVGQLFMRGATLTNEAGFALGASGVTVGGDGFLDGAFTASGHGELGAVNLAGARIGGLLVMRGATVTNKAGPALVADGATVGGDGFLDGGFTAIGQGEQGAVRLAGARIAGHLQMDAASVDRARTGAMWVVDGLTYDGYPSVGFDEWLVLLHSGTPAYRPQPYRQLAAAARAAGHDDDARRALIRQRDDQVKRGGLTRPAKAWARFTKFTLGYGYQPWRALLGVAVVLLAAVMIVFFTPGALAHTPGATACTRVEAFQIAVDMAIPLVSTSSGSSCHITATPSGQFVAWASVFLTFSGWALTALFAAGFTRAIRQP
ncbi:hypothetical protein [Agromyces aureus]|uniref:hypothetical protein n=1 Tax=Agromyces aureus TaxID=453304 RepID=UPI001260369B|nr:hypothetical protein [Agromyces aureus]